MLRTGSKFLILMLLVGCTYNDFDDIVSTNKAWDTTDVFAQIPVDEPIGGDIIAAGVVVSSDSCGSFYREIVLQDFADSTAVALQLNFYDSYAMFNIGDVVAVNFNGLTITRLNGRLVTSPAIASPSIVLQYMHYQNRRVKLTPAVKTIEELSAHDIGGMVRINDVYFENLGNSFAGEQSVVQLANDETITLYTSSYASFATQIVPQGMFDILAIVVVDKKGALQLKISSPSNLLF